MGKDIFSVDSENICSQDRIHEDMATKIIQGVNTQVEELSGVTES